MNLTSLNGLEAADHRRVLAGMLWRSILVVIAANITGVIVANLIGVALGHFMVDLGQPASQTQVVLLAVGAATVSIMVSAAFILLYVRWLMSTRFGEYRLSFVRGEA